MITVFDLSRRLPILLSVFGPATIAAISDNDAAGVATYSLAGAQFGYATLFILLLITILLALTQAMGVRLAIVTRKGLGDLIRERYGIVISLLVFGGLVIANIGSIIANFAALKTISSMFHVPLLPFIALVIALAFIFISRGDYKTNQKIFLIGIVLYFAYVFSAIKGKPDWELALTSMIDPRSIKVSKAFVVSSIAVLGTTITPWGQFFIQSYMNDKKLPTDKLKYAQFETYFGAFLTNFFSFFMIVATAATLFVHRIPLTSGEAAALAIRPFAGELASVLFGVGLLNAALMGIIVISLSTAYAFAEFFGFEGSLDAPFEKGKLFYGLFLFQLLVAAGVILIPAISFFTIVTYTQFLSGILLPMIFFFLYKLTNNKELMGQYTNKLWYNYVIVGSSVVIIAATLFAVVSSVFKL